MASNRWQVEATSGRINWEAIHRMRPSTDQTGHCKCAPRRPGRALVVHKQSHYYNRPHCRRTNSSQPVRENYYRHEYPCLEWLNCCAQIDSSAQCVRVRARTVEGRVIRIAQGRHASLRARNDLCIFRHSFLGLSMNRLARSEQRNGRQR